MPRSTQPVPSENAAATKIFIFPDLDNLQTETKISKEPTHSSQKLNILEDSLTIIGDKGYRQAKANHGVTEGNWYFEVEILEMEPPANARIGWSQISGQLQAPCGYDVFSYGYRACPGTLFHDAQAEYTSPLLMEGYAAGDTLGVLLCLPPLTEDFRDALLQRRWGINGHTKYAEFEISAPMPTVPGSAIRYFRNGQDLGPAFHNLHLGMYFPSFSLYQTAKIRANFGPVWKCPPQTELTVLPMCRVPELTPCAPPTEVVKGSQKKVSKVEH